MNHNGIGLGLNISKQIVEQANGSIGVLSDGINKGSTFYFTMKMDYVVEVQDVFDQNNESSRKLLSDKNDEDDCDQESQQMSSVQQSDRSDSPSSNRGSKSPQHSGRSSLKPLSGSDREPNSTSKFEQEKKQDEVDESKRASKRQREHNRKKRTCPT